MATNAHDSLKMTPFTVIPTALITEKGICENAFLLYAYLASKVGVDGTAKFPGYRQIREDLGWPKTYTVKAYLTQLEQTGWLSWFSSKCGVSNRYWLAVRPRDFRV